MLYLDLIKFEEIQERVDIGQLACKADTHIEFNEETPSKLLGAVVRDRQPRLFDLLKPYVALRVKIFLLENELQAFRNEISEKKEKTGGR